MQLNRQHKMDWDAELAVGGAGRTFTARTYAQERGKQGATSREVADELEKLTGIRLAPASVVVQMRPKHPVVNLRPTPTAAEPCIMEAVANAPEPISAPEPPRPAQPIPDLGAMLVPGTPLTNVPLDLMLAFAEEAGLDLRTLVGAALSQMGKTKELGAFAAGVEWARKAGGETDAD